MRASSLTDGIVASIRPGIQRLGWSETARRSGIHRSQLHKCFGANADRAPELTTIERVLPVLGLTLTVQEVPR